MLKNIVFDVGDVLLAYRWKYPFQQAGLSEEEAVRVGRKMFSDGLWSRMDRGELSLAQTRDAYCEKYPEDAGAMRFFMDHPELMPVPRPLVWSRVHLLKDAGFRLYILSNYCEELLAIHTRGMSVMDEMDGKIISAKVHLCKPEPAIYQCLLRTFGLKAEECLFFDDRRENVEGARVVGIPAVQVLSQKHLLGELDRILAEADAVK